MSAKKCDQCASSAVHFRGRWVEVHEKGCPNDQQHACPECGTRYPTREAAGGCCAPAEEES